MRILEITLIETKKGKTRSVSEAFTEKNYRQFTYISFIGEFYQTIRRLEKELDKKNASQ